MPPRQVVERKPMPESLMKGAKRGKGSPAAHTAGTTTITVQVEPIIVQVEPITVTLVPPEVPPDGGTEPPPDGGGGEPPEPPLEGAVLLFEDTFRGGHVDQGKWWTRYIFGGPDGPGTLDYLNDEWERYRETGNHLFDGGGIKLNSTAHNGEFWPSGMLRSKQLFDLAGGESFYFEARVKSPRGKAVWPAFWLAADARNQGDPNSVRWPPEIDMMEIVNNEAGDNTTMLHCGCQVHAWDDNGGPQKYSWTETAADFNGEWSYWQAPFDFADDFHTIGLLYKRPNFTIYCDRELILSGVYDWVWDDSSGAPPAHVLLNLAIGGSWAGSNGVDESAFPQALEVDYIRVYGGKAMNLPQGTIGKDYEIT